MAFALNNGRAFLDALAERVLVCDGAVGTQIQAAELSLEDFNGLDGCNEILNVTRPDVIRRIHQAYVEAGADIIETNTFGSIPWVLDEYEIGECTHELSLAAAKIAREVADESGAFVFGAIGPGTKLGLLGQISFDSVESGYCESFKGLLLGGSDALLLETQQDMLNMKAGVVGAHRAMEETGIDVPLFVQVTMEQTGTMLLGSEIGAAVNYLECFSKIAGIGINCATGPEEMQPHVRFLSQYSTREISVMPNAGLPVMEGGVGVYKLTPTELASYHKKFVEEFGVSIVGGCCGTTPDHIRAVSAAIKGVTRAERSPEKLIGCSSLYQFQPYDQSPSFLIVGEKTNANGSRAFRDALAAQDMDLLVGVAREQEREGSHVLDVCAAYVGRDEVADMDALLFQYAQQVTIPLMIDTTEWQVAESALKRVPGKALINSIHFEDGGERLHRVLSLARKYGAGVVALTIDEEGMAKSRDGKLAIAERILQETRAYGVADEDVFFDCLTFTLGSGDEEFRKAGIETIEAIRGLKQIAPRANTILGISNISFGLKPAARHVLNSVFLHYARDAGLSSAIVHAGRIMPESRVDPEVWEIARQLVFDERGEGYDPLISFMSQFENITATKASESEMDALSVEDRLKRHIIDGIKIDLTKNLDLALAHHAPIDIINNVLLDGMKVVGELFGAGKMQLPFVLQSAEVMKAAVRYLEPMMDRVEGDERGSILLATVAGDVHDIGKNLVDIILSNNGYRVVNIGIKQPIGNILSQAEEHKCEVIGMSGLLVKSTVIMKENLIEMNDRNLEKFPVILGGAALTRAYVEEDLRRVYNGQLFYAQDAFEGLKLMGDIAAGTTVVADLDDSAMPRRVSSHRLPDSDPELYRFTGEKSDVATDIEIPRPPFFGCKSVADISPDEIYPYINEIALFRGQWGFKRPKDMDNLAFNDYLEEMARPAFDRMKAELREVLKPKVVYGYFPAQSCGNDLIVYSEGGGRELGRLRFPRQSDGRRLCIADFFASTDSGRMDVVAFHLVTVGEKISELERNKFELGEFQDYLYIHGMGVESAEALAEYWHKKIREELGVADDDAAEIRLLFSTKYRGCRYSFGYPACPNLEDQKLLFDFLRPEQIGVELTEEYMLVPEQSTSAIICHHPEAKYFNIR